MQPSPRATVHRAAAGMISTAYQTPIMTNAATASSSDLTNRRSLTMPSVKATSGGVENVAAIVTGLYDWPG